VLGWVARGPLNGNIAELELKCNISFCHGKKGFLCANLEEMQKDQDDHKLKERTVVETILWSRE